MKCIVSRLVIACYMLMFIFNSTIFAGEKPNVIFIMADDLGYRELGCYGQKKIRTPNIDKLASQGMKFTDYYCGSAVCAPSRCNLLTGLHGGHAYVRDNFRGTGPEKFPGQLPLPAGTVTIATVMKQNGFATGAFGKWGLGITNSTGDPMDMGFDRFFGYNCQWHAHNLYPEFLNDNKGQRILEGNTRGLTGKNYAPKVIADEMLKFIRDNKDKPFFIYYPTVLPHLALQAPQEDIDEYIGQWQETPYTGKSYLPHPTPRSCYAAMISYIDKQVGRIMALLDELDLADDTIIFFTSDNGTTYLKGQVDYEFFESVGELRGLKGSLFEGGIRMPMIVRWPGKIKPGTVTDHLSAHYDIMATLADLIDADSDVSSDGISFLPTLMGETKTQKQHEYLFWDFAGYGGQVAVRKGKWKGIMQNVKKKPDAPLELYNLEEDISESNNIAKDNPGIARELEKIMLQGRTQPSIQRFRFGKYDDK